MINRERIINNFIEMVKIYSPSKKEGKFANYLIDLLKNLGGEIYLDNGYTKYNGDASTIFSKFKGDLAGEGVTLCAHMDVIEPCENISPIIENGIIKTDGTTTLGGDDKGGVASIIEVLRVLKENNLSHQDIYVLLTPGEESGMLGAKSIEWKDVPSNIRPATNMIVLDNAGRAGIIAHSAPCQYNFTFTFRGKKAHAGIEPEKGINTISMAAAAIAQMKIGRINELTTSNIGSITSQFPTNVVPDYCSFHGEVRSHSEETLENIIDEYENIAKNVADKFNGEYTLELSYNYPILKPIDDLKFGKEFAKVYEEIGVESELKVIGGGSDSNILAKEGFNSIIVGVGMYKVHTVEEYLVIEDLLKTTEAILNYIIKYLK